MLIARRRTLLDADHLAWADEIVTALYSLGRAHPDRPPSVRSLAQELLKTELDYRAMKNEGELRPLPGAWQIALREGMPIEREPVVIGHELTHWWFKVSGETPPSEHAVEEALCDAVGARLSAPAVPFKEAMDAIGHRVHKLADMFHTTRTVTFFRVAELAGRAAAADRVRGRIVRGAAFDWPEDLWTTPRALAHPVELDDGSYGWMAEE